MTSLSSPARPPSPGGIERNADFVPLASEKEATAYAATEALGSVDDEHGSTDTHQDPPLPAGIPPPLPSEPSPGEVDDDDGWEPIWDPSAQAFYFYNRLTQQSQWHNPRIPESAQGRSTTDNGPPGAEDQPEKKNKAVVGGYNPAIHGDYNPEADYAKAHLTADEYNLGLGASDGIDPTGAYAATGAFNRFTGKWQKADLNPDKFTDEAKSTRQMNAYFDVDAAANSHDGKSLKAERSNKKLSKKDLKAFKEKRRERKEEKRRAWLRD